MLFWEMPVPICEGALGIQEVGVGMCEAKLEISEGLERCSATKNHFFTFPSFFSYLACVAGGILDFGGGSFIRFPLPPATQAISYLS